MSLVARRLGKMNGRIVAFFACELQVDEQIVVELPDLDTFSVHELVLLKKLVQILFEGVPPSVPASLFVQFDLRLDKSLAWAI